MTECLTLQIVLLQLLTRNCFYLCLHLLKRVFRELNRRVRFIRCNENDTSVVQETSVYVCVVAWTRLQLSPRQRCIFRSYRRRCLAMDGRSDSDIPARHIDRKALRCINFSKFRGLCMQRLFLFRCYFPPVVCSPPATSALSLRALVSSNPLIGCELI
jgi:hypothetical protein